MTRLAVAFALSLATSLQAETATTPEPFTIAVPDAALDDLRHRLRATRFAPAIEGAGHAYGFDPAYLQELVTYWAEDYDWRQEARLNAFEQFRVEIDGTLLHYGHAKSPREGAIPLLMLHGWPSSFVQMLPAFPGRLGHAGGAPGLPDARERHVPTPRSWIERQGRADHWTATGWGGHFMEWEKPVIVAVDLRAFFAALE